MIKFGFFFGAGISQAANLTSTSKLTNHICSQNRISVNSDEINIETNRSAKIEAINIVRERIKPFYDRIGHNVNYEDIYYVLNQIKDLFNFEYENSTIEPFAKWLLQELNSKMEDDCQLNNDNFKETIKQSCFHIFDCIVKSLSQSESSLNHLTFLYEVIESSKIFPITIFTLNHDILIEQFLLDKKIDICDGFCDEINGIKYFGIENFSNSCKYHLLKLHGSINWFRCQMEDNYQDQFVKACNSNLDDAIDYNENRFRYVGGSPEIL